ncbi:hypothetical protein [Roseisolibacter sp. H3M3-2]|uniref:hypothetical protein n=1 Tax=Roseisolibacter sp. H3M3-2 TaxID=3031323 RepID=UPI0023D99ADD|nr:hypothetical protein [Roseisolibacter sp. H3M3-2]MDF1504277.1 hypothetical protein [Roseisolibacter sp. H3M3-2]
MSAHHHEDVSRDKGPAFVGLVAGIVLIGAFVYAMVLWTNSRFEGHAAGGAAAATEAHK